MDMDPFTARANPNIAFVKYWGNRDDALRLPANGSISMNLGGFETRTTVRFEEGLQADEAKINGKIAGDKARVRISKMLDEVRALAGVQFFAKVESQNNFPTSAGMASSASAFAALAMASTRAAGIQLDEAALSRLARRSSGSACRSIPGGFVEWASGTGDRNSYAISIAPPEYWDLADCISIISREQKSTGSTEGHALAGSSPLQAARVGDAPRRLDFCRHAILTRDFAALADIVESDSNLMHAVMMTSHPPLFYWQPSTLLVMQTVREARAKGMPVCYTVDAGPNVHVICTGPGRGETTKMLGSIPGVREVRLAHVGGAAKIVENPHPSND
jgi:diphosphomevalonate decarboxylase